MKGFTLYGIILLGICLPLFALPGILNQNPEIDDVAQMDQKSSLLKPVSYADEAVGVLDKGQLQNLTMNYGQITDTRYEDVGNAPTQYFFDFRYPRKNFTGLIDDFSIFFAIPENSKNDNNGNVIEGWTDNDNEDWIAKDGSYGTTHYNPATDPNPHEPLLYPPDNPTTPYLAHSDLPATWPVDENGEAFWPGYFRRDRITGEEIEGEFASDRDVYAVFNDGNNQLGNVVGIEVEMMAYCYGRPYADKFQFYEFFIHNKSGRQLENCWVGYYQDPDCSDHGEEILLIPDRTFSDPDIPDIIAQRDVDGDKGGATRPNTKGVTEDYTFGIAILETPKNLGVSSFHYYQDAGPTDDAILWPIIISDPTDPNLSLFVSNYFHGTNPNYDNPDIVLGEPKQDLVFIVATGPFAMDPDEVVKSTLVVAVGEDDADFYKQIDQAVQMFDFKFVGPSAPPPPKITAIPGDGEITLYWDDTPENNPDPFTGVVDFEGYRIYRSQDNGQTWGQEVTDVQGNLIGYVPLVQFDLDNDISGPDPRNPFSYLGDNTGIRHTYVDEDVRNGIRYSYTIVSYDRGDSIIYSLETARGTSIADKNFVTVTPTPDYSGKIPSGIQSFQHLNGNGKADIDITILDDDAVTTDTYEIRFNGTPASTFDIVNATQDLIKASNLPLNFYDNPVVDGFQISVESEQKIGGIKTVTDGYGKDVLGESAQDSSGSWKVRITEYASSDPEVRTRDYEIRFTETGAIAYSFGSAVSSVAVFPVNFEVWDVTAGEETQIEFQVKDDNKSNSWEESEAIFIVRSPYTSPNLGDPITGTFPDDFAYVVYISNAASDTLQTPPQTGDVVKIESYRSVQDGDVFSFQLESPSFDPQAVDLSEIRAVPNPYIVGAAWEELQNIHQIRFMFLPPVCAINIYTLNGEKVRSIEHTNFTGDEAWNLTNEANQAVAFGIYVYVVSTPQGQEHMGKLAIIR
jgi:hypothetical protein